MRGWSGGAKVLCILHHWGVQLILAYSWARPAILVVGKGRGGMFLFLLFLHFHSCSSFFPVPLFHLLYSLFYLFSLSLGDDTKWPSRVDVSLNPNTINYSAWQELTRSPPGFGWWLFHLRIWTHPLLQMRISVRQNGKELRSWWDSSLWAISSWSALFAKLGL